MRNVKYLIEDSRESTENQDHSEFAGIKDREFLRYLNDGVERIVSQIVKKSPKVFTKEIIVPVDGSEYYALPYDIFLGNKITDVKYRRDNRCEWERLEPDYVANNDGSFDYIDADPNTYIRLAGKIALRPKPSRGQLRITYIANTPVLDLERGELTAFSVDANNQLAALTLDPVSLQKDVLVKRDYLTIVDRYGEILVDQVRFEDINEATGEVTLSSNPEVTTNLTGAKVVSGMRSSTHLMLDYTLERYVIAYCNMKILQRDGSAEFQIQASLLQEMEAEIVDSYAGISDDILHIPDIDKDFDEF